MFKLGFLNKQKIIAVIVLIVLACGIIVYSGSKSLVVDKMTNSTRRYGNVAGNVSSAPVYTPFSTSSAYSLDNAPASNPPNQNNGYGLEPVVNPADLLPKDENSNWGNLNPIAVNPGDVIIPDLLQAGYHIGLDTIGQTLRNANYQERSDPIIPKQQIGPWNQSTIEPDLGRVPLEVGYGCR